MKYLYIPFFLFLACISLQAQNNNTDFIFTKELNSAYRSKAGSKFSVLKVVKTTTIDSTTTPTKKTLSKSYLEALALYRRAKKDSIAFSEANKRKSNNKNEIAKVKNNINAFLKSTDDFQAKKHLLIEAQKISNKYGKNYLIYADAEINTANKSKFFVLSKNKLDLKIHLKRLLPKINITSTNNNDIASSSKENADVLNRLKLAKNKLRNTEKYTITPGTTTINKSSELKLDTFVFKPEDIIIGNFSNLGKHYISNNTKGSKVLTPEDIKKSGADNNEPLILIQNNTTKALYMVVPDYVENASSNKLAYNE